MKSWRNSVQTILLFGCLFILVWPLKSLSSSQDHMQLLLVPADGGVFVLLQNDTREPVLVNKRFGIGRAAHELGFNISGSNGEEIPMLREGRLRGVSKSDIMWLQPSELVGTKITFRTLSYMFDFKPGEFKIVATYKSNHNQEVAALEEFAQIFDGELMSNQILVDIAAEDLKLDNEILYEPDQDYE